MTRGNTKTKKCTNKNVLNIYTYLFIIILIIAGAIFAIRPQKDRKEFVKAFSVPYSLSDDEEREDRMVFEGFKTSFIPEEEVTLARKFSANRYKEKRSISYFDDDDDYVQFDPVRPKRMTNPDIVTQIREDHIKDHWDYNNDANDYKPRKFEAYKTVASHPELLLEDRGPLDDVVEQVRGQPELEEAEMDFSTPLYKPSKGSTTIHAFWKGEGDPETIRVTQANLMKKYMDPSIDPCEDFFQYACGNWAYLHPIPPDKAGYDTFEILRENLDTVLKDILEFKKDEHVKLYQPIIIPVDDEEIIINDNNERKHKHQEIINMDDLKTVIIPELQYDKEKSEIVSRIRRYLDKKIKDIKLITDKEARQRKRRKPDVKPIITKRQKSRKRALLRKVIATRSSLNKKRNKNTDNKSRKKLSSNPKNKREAIYKQDFMQNNKLHKQSFTNSAALKARFLYKSCMNHEILQKRGHQPLLDLIDRLGGWPFLDPQWNNKNFDWLDLVAKLRLYNNDILISEWVGPDIKNSDEFVIQFDQTSLGLPTREYYLQSSNKIYLDAYKNYIIKIGLLLGGDPVHVKRSTAELINFEKRLAKITSAPEDRRNVSDLYRRMPLRDLEALVPEIRWTQYLSIVMNRKVKPNETVVLFALAYIRHLVKLIAETESKVLCNYLLWRFVRHRVNNLDDRFQEAKQQFYNILFGREQAPPRWKNCVTQVNSNMGMALGSMFVRKYFDETSKNDTLTMTKELQQSFRELLHLTDWIDDETKTLAGQKVNSMILRIGYPNYILNDEELDERYREVSIHPDMFFENILNILQHLTIMEQKRLGQPVDKYLWNTAPAVVNAYYSRNKNQIMFPAGILQPPFYHRHFPRSLNYGGIGVVIGHEITHGFDDKGRLFDSDGNLHRWWSDKAIEAFHIRAQCLIDQYSQYVVPEILTNLDGVNTQGENIADNGGIKQAFRAYMKWLKKHGSDGETLPGLNHTNTQLFFLNFAQVWCGDMRPEAMRNKIKTAVHSPGRFRVIGTLSNSVDFAREFNCPTGSPMNPEHKCSVW